MYRNSTSVSILLTGKTGSDKSTLVNGILGVNVSTVKGQQRKEAASRNFNLY